MSARQRPSTPPGPSRTILTGLAAFVGLAAVALVISLVIGATALFNVLVWAVFAVLWAAFAAALVFGPGTLDGIWRQVRALPLPAQAVVWLLLLPVMIGLWIWETSWPVALRLVLVVALGAWTVWFLLPGGMPV